MASSTKESASSSEQSSSVQPSATLIEALHKKLCDPSIVPKFEQCRPPNVTHRLFSHRWILKSSVDKVSGDDKTNNIDQAVNDICSSSKDDSTQMRDTKNHNGQQTNNNNNNKPKYNTVPQRTYLTIRIEQNKHFANDQYLRCQKKLAALSSTSPKSVEAINVNRLTIQKVIDAIRNQLKEGLAACPDHGGLIQVEREVRVWMDRLNGVDSGGGSGGGGGFKECSSNVVLDTAAVSASAATRAEERRRGNTETISSSDLTEQQPNTQQHIAVKRKGGDGRAQAAMDDAMVEKMFLQGHDGDSTNHDEAVDTNNNLKWAPPASSSRVDQNATQQIRKDDHMSDYSDSYHDRKRSRHHKRSSRRYRSRSRSVERRREDRRKGERKRHHRHHHRRRDDDRKRKKRRHRSRSRSMSRGSASSPEEEASLSSRSTSRDRSRRRRDRHSRHSKRRHKSKSHRKERRKSSKRHHRSRRERSQSVSSSSSAADDDVDGIKDRFVPPSVQHRREEEGAVDIKERFVPPQQLSQSVHHGRKEEERADGIAGRFVPPHSVQHVREEERAVRKEDIEVDSMPKSNDNQASAGTNR